MLRLKEPVRVQNKHTKVKLTLPQSAFDADVYALLDEEPNNPDGSPRAAEHPKPLSKKGGDPAASSEGQPADTTKEK